MEQSPFEQAATTGTTAIYEQFGQAATYTPNAGTASAVTLLVDSRTTQQQDKQGTRSRHTTLRASVRLSEVANLGRGDTFQLDGESLVFRVIPASVMQDGIEWDFEANAEVTTAVGAVATVPDR